MGQHNGATDGLRGAGRRKPYADAYETISRHGYESHIELVTRNY
jgi:hypothetical protein